MQARVAQLNAKHAKDKDTAYAEGLEAGREQVEGTLAHVQQEVNTLAAVAL